MIARLVDVPDPVPLVAAFLAELRPRGFAGDLSVPYANYTVLATDNPSYQRTLQAIAFPRSTDDLVRIAHGAEPSLCRPHAGAHGQSLTDGLEITQQFTDQPGPDIGRMLPLSHALPRGAHRIIRVRPHALHVRKRFPYRWGHVQKCGYVECIQASGRRLLRDGKSRAV